MTTAIQKTDQRVKGQATITGPQDVFAWLVRNCGVPSAYVSDVYHDAMWLDKHWADMTAGRPFYFVRRERGTHIGFSRSDVIVSTLRVFEDVRHAVEMRITPTHWNDQWFLSATEVAS